MDSPFSPVPNTFAPLISNEDILQRVEDVAAKLAKVMRNDWVVVALMDGAIIFAADLLRALYSLSLIHI